MIAVEVVYALPEQQTLAHLCVPEGSSVQNAIVHSGILQQYPSIDLNQNAVGIFGRCVPLTEQVKAGDRIEIYRPLHLDPKEARRLRQKNQKNGSPLPLAGQISTTTTTKKSINPFPSPAGGRGPG